ncbi:MAG TPA: HAD family hydrolase [Gammaproteobacteria bacterium]|nr:HAD family hydrolase [Gammaproteobacteria bacterium]
MNVLQLLIFDWDGTLMDSAAKIVACMQAAARDVAVEEPTPEAVRDIIGLGLRHAMERLFPGHDEALFGSLTEQYRYHFVEANQTPEQLFNGADDTLKQLEEAGYLLAIATGKSRVGLDRSLQHTGLRKRFHVTRCADETRGKPHPQMLEEILEVSGLAPQHALMIGDTEYDLQMAASIGMPGVGVTYGVHSRERLLAQKPLSLLSDITHLPDWLKNRN